MTDLFSIRHAQPADLSAVLAIYARARAFMAENGNPRQWNTTWPPAALVEEDIAQGRSYVCCKENEIVGVFVFMAPYDDATYHEIFDGTWRSDRPYGVVHRIATSGTEKGVGFFCLNWAFEQFPHLRIDTHGDNVPMQHLVEKCGFVHCGTIYVEEDDDPRLAYERLEGDSCRN